MIDWLMREGPAHCGRHNPYEEESWAIQENVLGISQEASRYTASSIDSTSRFLL